MAEKSADVGIVLYVVIFKGEEEEAEVGSGGSEDPGEEEEMNGMCKAESSDSMPDSPRMKIFGVVGGRRRMREM